MNTEPLVLYHKTCRDGQASAWVAKKAISHAVLVPIQYGDPVPDIHDSNVFLVDFSFKRDVMINLIRNNNYVTVLDHHKTAEEALEGLQDKCSNCTIIFDMNRSGAGIAWDFFFTNQPRPWFINYVEDRDLWRWKLPSSREINAFIASHDYEPATFDYLVNMSIDNAEGFGRVCQRVIDSYIGAALTNMQWALLRDSTDFYHRLPIVNAIQHSISEVLEAVMNETGSVVAGGWWRRSDGKYQHSLRSRGDFDVSAIARHYGGGGHKNAAGFEAEELRFRVR